jgi:transketolase
MSTTPELEARGINVIRGLAMDAVQKANSGHPGTPMALAPLAHVLFTRVMRYDAADPEWFDRDRFVLSNGHASMLLYSMLYLCGFGLELDDLREFRQWGSRTPGHPEFRHTRGVELTTGPLGQGVANGVGFALAEKHLRQRFGAEVCDHHVFGIAGDGCFMEGISHEAASFAGHFKLGRLVFVYDDNHITIDGPTELAYSDNVPERFEAYGWHVLQLGEAANDLDALEAGLCAGIAEEERPTLLVLRSHIGYPSPKYTDTAEAHGNPLGEDEVRVTKGLLGLPEDETFYVPDDVLAMYRDFGRRGDTQRNEREQQRARWIKADPGRGAELEACIAGRGLDGWAAKLPQWTAGDKIATRNASKEVLSAIFDVVPGLIGGAADLTGNTGTLIKGAGIVDEQSAAGRIVHFGIREHGMGSIANGMSVSSTLPFVGTFFVFSDYMRPSARLAALARYKVAFVWTHDSVGVGEDGPTHQPIEQLASLRAMPGLSVIRPADANETSYAWQCHIDGDGPTAIILTRQNIPVLEGTAERAEEGVPRGAYVLVDETAAGAPQLILIGTGSEVAVCAAAAATLRDEGVSVRVVSMPSWDRFEQQTPAYRGGVLPRGVPTLAVEAAASFGWERYADDTVSIDRFGASAPGNIALDKLGINETHVLERARALLTGGK